MIVHDLTGMIEERNLLDDLGCAVILNILRAYARAERLGEMCRQLAEPSDFPEPFEEVTRSGITSGTPRGGWIHREVQA